MASVSYEPCRTSAYSEDLKWRIVWQRGSSRCITWSHCVAVGQRRCSHSLDCIRLSFFFALLGSSLFLHHLIHCQESSQHTKVKYEVFPQNVHTSLEGHQLISTFSFIVAFPQNSQHWTPHYQECHLQTHDTKPDGSFYACCAGLSTWTDFVALGCRFSQNIEISVVEAKKPVISLSTLC